MINFFVIFSNYKNFNRENFLIYDSFASVHVHIQTTKGKKTGWIKKYRFVSTLTLPHQSFYTLHFFQYIFEQYGKCYREHQHTRTHTNTHTPGVDGLHKTRWKHEIVLEHSRVLLLKLDKVLGTATFIETGIVTTAGMAAVQAIAVSSCFGGLTLFLNKMLRYIGV